MIYSRQEKLGFIPKNFHKITKNKKIALIGCGGVGSVLAELLVRGGFLNLILIDNDLVDETNLGRQNFSLKDVGEFKSQALVKKLEEINPKVNYYVEVDLIDETNCNKYLKECDLIIDCSDNFETRKIINSYCLKNKIDWIYSGAVKTEFITTTFYHKDNLFSKVFPKEVFDEKCCDVGVLASTTFACASLVYNQVLKYFLNIKEDNLIKIDLWTNKIFNIKIKN